jgi:predicted metal-binding membrane protein
VSSINAGEGESSAPARAQLAFERAVSSGGLIAGAALLVAIVLAWRWLAVSRMGAMDGPAMAAMAGAGSSAAYLAQAFAMWAVMMVAMMLPSAAPMILLHARIDRAGSPARRLGHSLAFALAYLFVWTAFAAAAALLQALLVGLGLVSAIGLALGDRAIAAALLAGAALYQLSPVKAACLGRCRSPIHFVLRYWSPGLGGTIRLGLVHGAFCVGCCWALMLLLFVAGVMKLAWIALLAAIVLAEKTAPPAWRISRAIAGLLLAAALALLAGAA